MRPSAGCGALSLLLEVNLCDNNLQMLPSDLGLLLGSLQTLRIAGNPLSLLPPALIQPDASDELLRYLLLVEQSNTTLSFDISSRSLGHIPGHVFEMLHLRILNVADNGLTVLPDAIGRLNELTDLILDDNLITTLPLGFGECHRITRLSTLRMKLTSPPDSILSRGVQVTREWIKRLCDASSSELGSGADDEGLRLDLSSLCDSGIPSSYFCNSSAGPSTAGRKSCRATRSHRWCGCLSSTTCCRKSRIPSSFCQGCAVYRPATTAARACQCRLAP